MSTTQHIDFLSPLSVIPHLGPKRVDALAEAGLIRVEDLLNYLPRSYVDKRSIVKLQDVSKYLDTTIFTSGTIISTYSPQGKSTQLRATLSDGTGTLDLLWFQGASYLKKMIIKGTNITVLGKVSFFKGYQMSHPEIECTDSPTMFPVEPRYLLSAPLRDAKIGQKVLRDAILWLFAHVRQFPATLPEKIEALFSVIDLKTALYGLHFPDDPHLLSPSIERLKVEELYLIALTLRWRKRSYTLTGISHPRGTWVDKVRATLPYDLTADQMSTIHALHQSLASSERTHALIQGDVGCGKTVTAALAALPALENSYQVAWLAPTSLLAVQTYETLLHLFTPLGITVVLLTSLTPTVERRNTLRDLSLGKPLLLVGTHSLIQQSVIYGKLGVAIIDEQHRFGAQQRQLLQSKAPLADHIMLSATPIPQSLASTLYSDLSLYTIRSNPRDRKPIKTHLVPFFKEQDLLTYLKEEIKTRKVFWVVPRIESVEENVSLLGDITNRYTTLINNGIKEANIAIVHGQQKEEERLAQLHNFTEGTAHILIATTVIEVGIHIPQATIMIIENPDRFGLAQLHQIRGRVGRSDAQSWAYLLYNESIQQTAVDRLMSFKDATDGFEIAELDLKLRGTGQVAGDRQSGLSELRFSSIIDDAELFRKLQSEINTLMK